MTDREAEAVRLLRAGFNARQTAAVMGITLGAANGIRFRRSGMVATPLSTDEIEAARARIRSGARPAEAKPKPANEAEPTAAADILLAAARAAVSARRDGGIVRSATKRPPVVESLPPLLAASVVAAPEQDDPWSDINIAALREMWGNLDITTSEIGRRLGIAHTTVSRGLGPRGQAPAREGEPGWAPAEPLFTEAGREPEREPGAEREPETEPGAGAGAGGGGLPPGGGLPAWPLPAEGVFASRYAGAMLLHAFGGRAGAGEILAAAAGGEDGRPGDAALLSAVSTCFALGAATTEQFKHLAAAEAGPLAGLAVLPGLRALRPQLAAIADRTDPLRLQSMFASAMLAADPVTSGVYYVDDHFVPYAGARPVGKGWNNKRGRAEKGRADTHVTAHDGRAVCFVTGEPSGLTVTLPKALAELKKAAGPGAKIMLGFDRGGAYAQVFRHCRDQDAHWVTYRRAPLAVPAMLPVITTVSYAGRARQLAWAEETVQIKDYGEARQITLFEHGKVALQILTSDFDACPAEILAWLKSRWREENFLKYASENYGIDKICDYLAGI